MSNNFINLVGVSLSAVNSFEFHTQIVKRWELTNILAVVESLAFGCLAPFASLFHLLLVGLLDNFLADSKDLCVFARLSLEKMRVDTEYVICTTDCYRSTLRYGKLRT